MLNISSDVLAAHPWGPCLGASPSAYHPPVQTGQPYGGHFFTPRAAPGPPPTPGSHSP
jgi:hypothetical protein